jgi:hypothetical protein
MVYKLDIGALLRRGVVGDLFPPPVPSIPNSTSLPQPYAQPDDGPINGLKHVVVVLLYIR